MLRRPLASTSTIAMNILSTESYGPHFTVVGILDLPTSENSKGPRSWLFYSLAIQVHVTSSIGEHDIQGDLSPCFWTTVLHVWLIINYFLFPLKWTLFYTLSVVFTFQLEWHVFYNTGCSALRVKARTLTWIHELIFPLHQQPGRISTGNLLVP